MRIISGKYRSRKLSSIKGSEMRPTLDRVKEALFSSLGIRVQESIFGDFFAGSGSIGLEALSRGAGKVIFIEKNRSLRSVIEKNCQDILYPEDHQKWQIFPDVFSFWQDENRQACLDILFCDPPYAAYTRLIQENRVRDFMDRALRMIRPGGLLVLEAPVFFFAELRKSEIYPQKEKKYGHVHLLYYETGKSAADEL